MGAANQGDEKGTKGITYKSKEINKKPWSMHGPRVIVWQKPWITVNLLLCTLRTHVKREIIIFFCKERKFNFASQ